MTEGKAFLTPGQLAARYGISLAAVRKWRVRKVGPQACKIEGSLRYRLEDVLEYERKCRERIGPRVQYGQAVFSTR